LIVKWKNSNALYAAISTTRMREILPAGFQPGTSFSELPADYICPVCGAGKDEFEKYG